jgi:rare lipoprotein A
LKHPALLVLLVALVGCSGPTPQPRYVVGQPYRLGGVWSYPAESFSLTETGVGQALSGRSARLTANGERWDASLPMGAHRTLQLPAVLRVQNLENGRTILLRVNDRGPERAGRVLGLSSQAASTLGVAEGGTAQLRIAVEAEMSRALANRTAGRQVEALPVEAAPRASVTSESLAPPPGARDAGRARATPVAALASEAAAGFAEVTVPNTVTQGSPQPGVLVVEAGTFSRADAAGIQMARLRGLGATIEQRGGGTSATYRVRIGPVATLAEADRMLERVLASGVSEAAIRVE